MAHDTIRHALRLAIMAILVPGTAGEQPGACCPYHPWFIDHPSNE